MQLAENCFEMSVLDSELAALPCLSAEELRAKWRDLRCGESTAASSRDLMIREIAYKLQERAHGGLAPTVKRRLRTLADGFKANGADALIPAPLLEPGTRLLREWGGKTHTIIVLEDGFEHGGERYPSLTQIARRITGVHWSGPLFFGISKRRRAVVEGAADAQTHRKFAVRKPNHTRGNSFS